MADEDESLSEQQDEEYMKKREQGMSKEEAANEASPPDSTDARAESAEDNE